MEKSCTPKRQEKIPIYGLFREEIAEILISAGIPAKQVKMRSRQIWNGLYVRGIRSFSEIHNVSDNVRSILEEKFSITNPEIVTQQISIDQTRKWLLRFSSTSLELQSVEIETVYIPEKDRGTLCISSQAGCTLNCSFCYTGTQKLVRNLTAEEIVSQIMIARRFLDDFPARQGISQNSSTEKRKISNIVVMGMGEPLYNFEAIKRALLIASDGEGLSISKRRITLSTSGVVPKIVAAGEQIGVMLAISLHATNDILRNTLVPLNKKYPLNQLMEACKNYPGLCNAKRITFEYVMLKNINDQIEDAKALVRLLKGIPAKINLIPFNPWPETVYECSEYETVRKFSDYLNRSGYSAPIRMPRGRDILAACGQLKSQSQKMRKSELLKMEAPHI